MGRYGGEKAQWLMGQILRNYNHLALINTGQYELECFRATTVDVRRGALWTVLQRDPQLHPDQKDAA